MHQKLPFVVGWQDLKDLFRSAGNVQRANIMQGRDGRSKGHGIVLYATVADAQKAISTFDGYEWHGRRLEVREDRSAMDFPPPPPRTEGANNSISKTESENEIIVTTNGISSSVASNEINGATSTQTTSSPVDYSITTNENISMNGITLNGTHNGTTYVDESMTRNSSNNTSTNSRRQLFIGNLPFRMRWQDLKDLFRKAGTVLRADVAMGPDNRSKGHGTVLFGNAEDAKNAIAMFNHYNWQGRDLEVREDRGFVDPTNVNNHNGQNQNIQQNSQEYPRRVIDPMATHNHAQPPYMHSAPIVQNGIIFSTRGIQTHQQNYAGRLLFVGNLPFNCQWQDLKDLFRNAGNIIRADVSTNYDGRSRGFGTVLFATPEDARNAVGMYNGYEFQGRTLRVHFDKFTFPPLPPHHHNPPPHPVHLPPPPVHPHHRPPPPLISSIPHHNFHMAPPPIPHPHFISPAHMGAFSPPLATPSLTSPPLFHAAYNSLAHINSQQNASSGGSVPFQPIPIVSNASSIHHGMGATSQHSPNSSQNISQDQAFPATQFSGFGPIGKIHHSPQSNTTSSISNLSVVGFSGASNTINGIVAANGTTDNNYGTANDNMLHNIASSFANLHLSPTPQQLFFHPAHHPHHRPPIPTAYHPHHHHQVAAAAHAVAAAHHHHQHQHQQHQQHNHPPIHHPGAIGSGLVGTGGHIHSDMNGTSSSLINSTCTTKICAMFCRSSAANDVPVVDGSIE